MSRTKDFAFLRLLFTSGIDLVSLMPVASECLKRLIPSFSLSMIRVDARCAPHHHYSEYFDEFSHRLLDARGHHFALQTSDPAAFSNLMRNRVPYGALVQQPPGFLQGAFYKNVFERNGMFHVLDVALRDANGPLGILGIFREKRSPPFTRSEVAIVHELYPLLVHASVAKPLPSRYDEVESAMLVVSPEGRIVWASQPARQWLEGATAHAGERASLVNRHMLPEACQRLCRSLGSHQSGKRHDGTMRDVPSVTLPLPGGRLRLRAYSLAPQLGNHGEAQVGVQLTLEMHRGLRMLRALEGCPITPQQRRLAIGLWQGKQPQEISAELGLSANSLKSYQKDLYARLEVSSARDLVALLERQADAVRFNLYRHLPRPDGVPADAVAASAVATS